MKKLSFVAGALACSLTLVACGDDDDTGASADGEVTVDGEDFAEDPQGAADEMAGQLEDLQEAEGGGSATLTIGDETWEFDSVLCAFGNEETGREETEFVLSSIKDGLQLNASIDTEFGHSVSINDIEDFENQSVSWEAGGPLAALTGGDGEEIIQIDGKEVSASATFRDMRDEMAQVEAEGTLNATCP